MHFRHFALLASALLALLPDSVTAQLARRRPTDYRRSGLEVVWMSHVELDRNRSETGEMQLQVVGMGSHQAYMQTSQPVFEVRSERGVRRFRGFDLGPGGQPIGAAEAERLAEKEMIRLNARGLKPELSSLRVPPTILYIQSSSGTLHSFDAETGKTIWAVIVGNPRYQSLAPAANDKYVATINGSTLYLLDRLTGEQIWERSMQHNPAIGPTMSRELVFAPSMNGKIEGHWLPREESEGIAESLKLERPTWYVQSDSQVTARMTTTPVTLSWPTHTGRVYVADLKEPEVVFRLRTGGAIYSSTVPVPPNRLAIASTDGYIYCIDETTGDLLWEYSTGEAIREPIVAFGDQVYAITEFGNLHCVSAVDGIKRWLATHMRHFISASSDRIYVMDHLDRTVALDQKSGGRVTQLSTGRFNVPLVNRKTDRLYLATRDGGIMCLREIDAEIPLLHQPIPQPEPKQDEAEARPARPARDEFSPPDIVQPDAGENPFAPGAEPFDDEPSEPATDDPFAPGADPFAPGADPFAPGADPFNVDNGPEDPTGTDNQPLPDDEDPFQ